MSPLRGCGSDNCVGQQPRELVGENLRAQSAGGTADLSSLRDFTLARSESHQLTLVASEMSPPRGCRSDNCIGQQAREPATVALGDRESRSAGRSVVPG